MTWVDVARAYDPNVSEETVEFILWNETAFPFSDFRYTVGQLRSALRAHRNGARRCELCSGINGFHAHYCLNHPQRDER